MKANEGKKQQVKSMFNSIAHRYDFLNHFLSAGIDIHWRNKAIKTLAIDKPEIILDVATGTGDLAIAARKLNPGKIIGIDIAEDMLAIGREKIKKIKSDNIISLKKGDSENIQFENFTFDVTMVAFGVRNFENLKKGLSEMHRVLKKDGKILILEFSKPTIFPVKQLYNFYFRFVLPTLGKVISGDKAAYTYLPESVGEFPKGQEFLHILKNTGFVNTKHIPLTFGIASIYTGTKK